MAARRARAAARPDAADRRNDGVCRERSRSTGMGRGLPGGTPEARVGGGPQHPDRHSPGGARRGVEATTRERTCRVAARPHSFAYHSHHRGAAATNAHHPHRVRSGRRSGRQRLGREFSAAGRQRHWFHQSRGSMAGKWLELLKQIAPRVNRAAILFNPATAPYADVFLNSYKATAASFAVEAIVTPVRDTSELESVVAAQAREPNSGLVVIPSPFMAVHRAQIIALAARYRLPAVYPFRFFAEIGGLLSYGSEPVDNF